MKLEVLISCMYQKDLSIAERSMVKSDALIINQSNEDRNEEIRGDGHLIRMISTTERGLSKSRNMAIINATGDICLICDDDEQLCDDLDRKIVRVFEELPIADIIAFKLDYKNKKYPKCIKKINYLTALKISSVQIAFRRESILKAGILFDESVGSGVSKAGGEEVIFLYNCLKQGLKLYYYPLNIGKILNGESQWFQGFSEEYFYDRGIFTCKMMGKSLAWIYGIYFLVFKYSLYKNGISFMKAYKAISKGIFSNDITNKR